MFENMRYVVFPSAPLGNIKFAEIFQTSVDTLRYNTAGNMVILKFHKDYKPQFVGERPLMTHAEALALMATDKWRPL